MYTSFGCRGKACFAPARCSYVVPTFLRNHWRREITIINLCNTFHNNRLIVHFKRLFAFSFGTKREFAMMKCDNLKCTQ
jgi:hypothetical protein